MDVGASSSDGLDHDVAAAPTGTSDSANHHAGSDAEGLRIRQDLRSMAHDEGHAPGAPACDKCDGTVDQLELVLKPVAAIRCGGPDG